MVKKVWLKLLLPGVLILIVGVGMLVKLGMERATAEELAMKFPDRGVPRMNITLDGVSLEEINSGPKDEKYEGNKLALYEGNEVREFEGVQVKGRGNTTWEQPKKPYQIKFDKKVNLLGMGKAKKWILLANYLDASQLRNDIALYLAEMLGVEYNYRGKFVELYVDGKYEGLYYLVKKIEIGKGSVDLKRDDALLFELDMLHKKDENFYETYFGEHLVLKDSLIGKDDSAGIVSEFISDFNEAERAIENRDYEKIKQLLDVESFVKYYLVNEFAVNPDAYSTSFYLYRNNDGKIAAGPVWDFDLAFANRRWISRDDEEFFSPRGSMVRRGEAFGYEGEDGDRNIPRIFYYLMDMPEFSKEVDDVYENKMSGRKDELIREIYNKIDEIKMVVVLDGKKWGEDEFEENVNELIRWVNARYDYFEEKYGASVLQNQ